ncbi:MAG: CPBP family intramembrane metalloprotease [Thermoplasmata archaeon]|nr:MAG: CPBP family intramembrane metalloprotease [Thermoplasmata archaeon]
MNRISFKGMVTDPFSFFNIFLIFIVALAITTVVGYPLLEYLVFKPAGTSFFSSDEGYLDLVFSPKALFISLALQNIALVSLIYLRVIKFGGHTQEELGISTKKIGKLSLLGLGWGIIIIAVVTAVTIGLALAGLESEPSFGIPEKLPELALILVAGVVFAPIGEELYFRAYIMTAVSARYNKTVTFTFSALFFAVLHLSLEALIPILLMGFFLAYIFDRYKSITPCIIIHAMNNFIAIMWIFYFD